MPPNSKRKNTLVNSKLSKFKDPRLRSQCRVVVSKDLRRIADRHLVKITSSQTDWNPSWDDDDASSSTSSTRRSNTRKNSSNSLKKWTDLSLSSGKTDIATATSRASKKTSSPLKNMKPKISLYKKSDVFKNWRGLALQSPEKCGEEYEDMAAHSKDYQKETQLNSLVDGRSFQTFDVESKPEELKCNHCGKTFLKKIHLTLHQKIHARMDSKMAAKCRQVKVKSFPCTFCQLRFGTSEDLLSHYTISHSGKSNPLESNPEPESEFEDQVTCAQCYRQFKSIFQLNAHRKLCTSDQIGFHDALFQHLEETQDSEEPQVQVNGRHQIYLSEVSNDAAKSDSTKSLSSHLKPPSLSEVPSSSPSIVINKTESINHRIPTPVEVKKKDKPKFSCSKCDKKFFYRSYLDFHMKSHAKSSDIQKPNPEQVLLAAQTLIQNYSVRVAENTELKLPFKCENSQCANNHFSEAKDLMIHIKHKHFNEKENLLSCESCGKEFLNSVELNKHRLSVHNLSQPTFHYLVGKDEEMKLPNPYVLLEEKSVAEAKINRGIGRVRRRRFREDIPLQAIYTCYMCSKTFKIRQHYMIHLSQHRREEMFKCHLCPAKCTTQSTLDAHIKKHDDPNYVFIPGQRGRGRGRVRTDIPFQDIYTCSTCSETFDIRQHFLIHRRQHELEEKYKCNKCEAKFVSESLLKTHLKRHKDPNYTYSRRGFQARTDIPFQDIYTCNTCSETFKVRQRYIIHLNQHKLEEKFKCHLCPAKCMSQRQLDAHVKKHDDPNYVFIPGKGGALRGRVRADVPFEDIYTCSVCSKTFEVRNEYLIHLRKEQNKCHHCGAMFLTEDHLEAHVKKHEDPNYIFSPGRGGRMRVDIPIQDEYTCETCDRKFTQRNYYLSHLSMHAREKEDPDYTPEKMDGRRRWRRIDIPRQSMYQCEICEKKFYKRNLYISHIGMHKREEKYTCPLCERKCQTEALYVEHLNRHKDPNYDPTRTRGRFRADIPIQDEYTCDKCSRVFKERILFIGHLGMHSREEKFTCNICGRKCMTKFLLDDHLKRHEDPNYVFSPRRRPPRSGIPYQSVYSCEYCAKKFNKRGDYMTHLYYHKVIAEGRYKCQICERAFITSGSLEVHVKRHEDPNYVARAPRRRGPQLGEYTCEICNEKFTGKGKYRIHMYTVHKEHEFKCQTCNKSFINAQRLMMHKEKHSDPNYTNRPGRRGREDVPVQDVYYCKYCGYKKSFTERQKYLMHLRNHEQQEKSHVQTHVTEKSFKCEDCLKMFKTKIVRDLHKQKYCKKIPCKYKCGRCSDRFHNKITLARHFERWHAHSLSSQVSKAPPPAEIELSCRQCSQTFNTSIGLNRHVALYHPITEVTFKQEHDLNGDGGGLEGALTLGSDEPNASNDNEDDWDNDDDMPMLSSFCETEISENPGTPETPTMTGSTLPTPNPRPLPNACGCGSMKKKYKTQKMCVNSRCPCVSKMRQCGENCMCKGDCLNTSDREMEQQQIFKEGRESMILEQQQAQELSPEDAMYNSNSPPELLMPPPPVPVAVNNTSTVPKQPASSYQIVSSEFISIDSQPSDESLRQLSFSGYVEGAEDDPLADPLSDSVPPPPLPPPPPVHQPQSLQPSIPVVSKAPTMSQIAAMVKSSPMGSDVAQIVSTSQTQATNIIENVSATTLQKTLESFDPNKTAHLLCQFCKKFFKTIPSFVSHIFIHKEYHCTFQCPICTKGFSPITNYVQHLDSHNKGIVLQCARCSSKFKSYADMQKHLKVHHFRPMECGLCNTKFPNSHLMMTHWTKEHPTCQCGLCMIKFFSYEDLTFHMRSLHSPFDCSLCGVRADKVDDLLNHFKQNHNLGTDQFLPQTFSERVGRRFNMKCSICNLLFSSQDELNGHLANHLHPNDPGNSLKCGQCPKSFTSTSDLHDHIAAHIMGTGGPSPSSSNPSSSSYSAYNINDNAQAKEVISCPKCPKVFENRSLWLRHVRSHNLIFCAACFSVFNSMPDLEQHFRAQTCQVHQCPHCVRNFRDRIQFNHHLRTNHADKNQSSTQGTVGTTLYSLPVIVGSTSLAPPVFSMPPQPRNSNAIVMRHEIEEITLD